MNRPKTRRTISRPPLLLGVAVKSANEIVTELLEAKTVDDIAKLGDEVYLCKALNEVYAPFVLTVDTYEKLFAGVEAIRRSLRCVRSYPFINRQAEAIFALTELEGRKRNRRLGFTDAMYKDRTLSRQWYRSIAQLVHSDKNGGDSAPMQLLKDLYEMMTHETAPED